MFNRMVAPLLLFTVQVLCSIMHKLPKDLFLRWSMSKFLECLRSWLHKWNTKKFILRKMMSAFTNRKAYQGLPIGEKLKAQIETHRVSRLKTAVQSRTTRKLTLSARWSRMTSIAVVTALTCYTNLSPVAALAPMPTARAIALAMPMLVLNASNDSPELIPNQWDTDSKTVGHDTHPSFSLHLRLQFGICARHFETMSQDSQNFWRAALRRHFHWHTQVECIGWSRTTSHLAHS